MTMVGRWWDKVWTWWTGPEFEADIEHVRVATQRLCYFLPTVGTVANIIAIGNPALLTVSAIAAAICTAVGQSKAQAKAWGVASLTPIINIDGTIVVIEGEFTK